MWGQQFTNLNFLSGKYSTRPGNNCSSYVLLWSLLTELFYLKIVFIYFPTQKQARLQVACTELPVVWLGSFEGLVAWELGEFAAWWQVSVQVVDLKKMSDYWRYFATAMEWRTSCLVFLEGFKWYSSQPKNMAFVNLTIKIAKMDFFACFFNLLPTQNNLNTKYYLDQGHLTNYYVLPSLAKEDYEIYPQNPQWLLPNKKTNKLSDNKKKWLTSNKS